MVYLSLRGLLVLGHHSLNLLIRDLKHRVVIVSLLLVRHSIIRSFGRLQLIVAIFERGNRRPSRLDDFGAFRLDQPRMLCVAQTPSLGDEEVAFGPFVAALPSGVGVEIVVLRSKKKKRKRKTQKSTNDRQEKNEEQVRGRVRRKTEEEDEEEGRWR